MVATNFIPAVVQLKYPHRLLYQVHIGSFCLWNNWVYDYTWFLPKSTAPQTTTTMKIPMPPTPYHYCNPLFSCLGKGTVHFLAAWRVYGEFKNNITVHVTQCNMRYFWDNDDKYFKQPTLTLFFLHTLINYLISHFCYHKLLLTWGQSLESCKHLLLLLLLWGTRHSFFDQDWLDLQLCLFCLSSSRLECCQHRWLKKRRTAAEEQSRHQFYVNKLETFPSFLFDNDEIKGSQNGSIMINHVTLMFFGHKLLMLCNNSIDNLLNKCSLRCCFWW